jgi:SpoVK/Ycf46/Vps4 family AAA+-type ATPase
MKSYANNLEHLLEELSRIDLLLKTYLGSWLEDFPEAVAEFRGLYVSETEIEQIQKNPCFGARQEALPDLRIERFKEINEIRREINFKIEESLKIGRELRLHKLSELFDLDSCEIDILLIGLAPELNLKFEVLYSYLQNDVTKKKPTIDLALNLLFPSIEEKIKSRTYFSPAAPLLKHHLIHLLEGEANKDSPMISSFIKTDERIINFLLEFDELDSRIKDYCYLIRSKKTFDDIILPEDLKCKLVNMANWSNGNKFPSRLLFFGPSGCGKKSAAEAICREVGLNLLVVDSKFLFEGRSSDASELIMREALLQNSALYLEACDLLFEDKEQNNSPEFLLRTLKTFPGMVFLAGKESMEFDKGLINNGFFPFSFPLPSYPVRKQLWESCMKDYRLEEEVDLNALASKFRFSGGQIMDASRTASSIAEEKNPTNPVLSLEDLYKSCKVQSNQKLSSFALKTNPQYRWEDIVLPKDTLQHLKEVSGFIKHKGKVHFDWGFEKKLSLGKGLNVLFSGPPGTGKTMAAEVLANETKLDLYKIDLSIVVSKYIGETEKNLKIIFEEAATSNSILFFDEADALFGKRSEVKDAHDRYANIETGYLLQKMEEYEGVVILATNLSKNIDGAFLRRMRFVIDFPFPDKEQRKQIWEGIFPYEAPISRDLNFEFISEKLNLSGGNIKNIALTAAFYAAEDSFEIGMRQIMRAARREYIKMGKPFLKEDFEPYYGLIEGIEK